MHRLAAMPGGWVPGGQDGVIFIEQTPAPLIVLTAADTDIQGLHRATTGLPDAFCQVRVANLLNLQQQLTLDTYAESVLSHAQIIVVRMLGGRAYWPYGLEVLKALADEKDIALWVLPGDDQPDLDLMSHSTVPLAQVNQLWRYFTEGGPQNLGHALSYVCDRVLQTDYAPPSPQRIPKVGIYRAPDDEIFRQRDSEMGGRGGLAPILFYRSHYVAGNLAPIDALYDALSQRGLAPIAIYVSSLKAPENQADLKQILKTYGAAAVILNTTSFAIAQLEGPQTSLWQQLDAPVLQVILSGGTAEQWQAQPLGLSPRDMAMNVALPEVDGRIITRAVSFKTVAQTSSALETDLVTYEPVADRIDFVAELAANWVKLRNKPACDRKIALILANYPNRDGRLANGVGLDTPASCVEIFKSLQATGYTLSDIPPDGDTLIQQLTQGVTNDPEGDGWRIVGQSLSIQDYQDFFGQLPGAVQRAICDRWGSPDRELTDPAIPISGLQLGNIFIGIQPSRGYDLDPSLNYHAPDLEPTHRYLAFYHWLRTVFEADAIIHVGKHGNLEWLPGKSIALSNTCYPEIALGPMPHLYPFIVNDPGEGAQTKRRAQAVIIDHLTPPLTRAELYGPLAQLESLVDEYYDAQTLDPSRVPVIGGKIWEVLVEASLVGELGEGGKGKGEGEGGRGAEGAEGAEGARPLPITHYPPPITQIQNPKSKIQNPLTDLLPRLDGYLCELKEAQIRDGLHIFGQCPRGRQLRDLIIAIARHPSGGRMGLTRAIASAWALDIDPLTDDLGDRFENSKFEIQNSKLVGCRTVGDVVDRIEHYAAKLIDDLLNNSVSNDPLNIELGTSSNPSSGKHKAPPLPSLPSSSSSSPPAPLAPPAPCPLPPAPLKTELHWITHTLLPALLHTDDEITHLLHGLDGRYVPAGPSGAPTRNRPEVLPTGRNFYSVDVRALPTESAWDVGRKAAEVLIENYTQEQGEYPKTLGLSMWGTAAMRTGGDDLAEALALLGVRPVWDGPSRRVVDFEILPLSALGRPRVDVTLRISGFFRDAFANLIDLFDRAVEAVAALDEPATQNPLAAQVKIETQDWQQQGLTAEQARARSQLRIFGSKPGAYGAGLQGLIEAQNWTREADLARAYINWSSYAYTRQGQGCSAPEAFQQRLAQMQVVLHNQDNREHDLLDSDDYYQFQGGLTAAVRAVSGQQPQTYFGDHAMPENPQVRTLKAEIARVYRSRVINPKWIAGVMRHGYKGAFEMSATLDYLFAYDATTGCVADHMYQGVADAYALDPEVSAFIAQANPWALRDIAERLLEAHQRDLWKTPTSKLLDKLRNITHTAEGIIESQGFSP
ncbi:MAG: cobaltochelatase subunit CobN [Cyanobacteria bacterium P01_G01_bin.38]